MNEYKQLKVWQLSHELTLDIYRLTKTFPKIEMFNLVSQMRRAAYSAPSNIIEGKSRQTQKEFIRFLVIARSSIDELSYWLLLSKDLGYINDEMYATTNDKSCHVAAMLNKLIKKIQR